MNLLPRQKSRAAGFTLIELLVSITILSLILFSLAQAIGFVAQLWVNGVGATDNMTKARDVLSVMNRDLSQMVLRPDTAAFVDQNGNSACAFYTSVQSNGTDTRSVSLVQYKLNPGSQTGVLGRLTYGMNYTSTITPIVSNPAPTALTQLGSSSTETLATGVIQFQYQFVDGTGTILNPPYVPTGSTSTLTTPFTFDYVNPRDTANPRAVVVSLVVLSNSAYTLASQNSTIMTRLQTDFPSTTPAANKTYGSVWNATLNPASGTFDSSLPVPVRSGLRVFQHYIPLPVITPSS
jgi:prepilin-type N-terminal cleavage/methylation domain-containing protein